MKPYGLPRREAGDDDVAGCVENGRPAGHAMLRGRGGDFRAFHSLRGGKVRAARRIHKRRARRENRNLCDAD